MGDEAVEQKDFLAEEAIRTPEEEIDVRIVLRENAELKEENAYLKERMQTVRTLTLLWNEYGRHGAGVSKRPYMNTQFGDKYRKWAKVTKATMRIQHKPGDVMEVDWAGNTLTIWDSVTGESSPAYLFVAVLPCSGYAYVEAFSDMKLEKRSLRKTMPNEADR